MPPSLFLFFYFSFSLFSIFWWPQWLFLFNSHFSSLGSFILSSLGFFPHFRGNNLFYKKYRRSFTLYKSTQHKEDEAIMIYANVCLCQCSRSMHDMKIK